jgi:ABC-type transport system involved in multi-copper enzyme maturation permease subunit
MGNCFKADIIRLHKKPSMAVFMFIQLILFAGFIIGIKILSESFGGSNAATGIAGGAGAAGLFVGIPAFLAVIKDDFRSRSMQVAIGFGVPRSRIVVCRFLEICMLFVETFVIQTILGFVLGMVFEYDMAEAASALADMWIGLIPVISHMAIALLVVYAAMNHTLGLVIYIVLELGVVNIVLSLVKMIPFLRDLEIEFSDYWVDGAVGKAMISPPAQEALYLLVTFAVYVVLPIMIAAIVFKKKELEA